MFDTRSHAWREAGLLRQISPRVVRRARIETLLLVPLFAGIVYVYDRYAKSYLETHRPFITRTLVHGELQRHQDALGVLAQIAVAVLLLALGWVLARAVGRAFGPALFRRMEPATAGTVGFLIRLITLIAALIVALVIAGVNPQTLAVGGAVTAVILGLAAQQTLGNVIAGTVLLSARPFRVGDRVRLQGSMLGGPIEGVVGALGLFYTTLAQESDSIMIPNSVALNALVVSREDEADAAQPGAEEAERSPSPEDADGPRSEATL